MVRLRERDLVNENIRKSELVLTDIMRLTIDLDLRTDFVETARLPPESSDVVFLAGFGEFVTGLGAASSFLMMVSYEPS
jgi:hypothetical protein